MCEVLRMASLLSVGLNRTVRATSVEGYKLPADAFVFSNLYGLNRDPRLWRSPHAFDVGHFFDEASGQLLLHNHFLPFSTGRLTHQLNILISSLHLRVALIRKPRTTVLYDVYVTMAEVAIIHTRLFIRVKYAFEDRQAVL